MSDIQSIHCPVCLYPFDAHERLPKISPACGHTVCKECLLQVLKMDTPKCPLDKLKFDKDLRTIHAFPTNFLGKELLEMKTKWTTCESHKKDNEIICLTDSTLVCSNCVIFGDHKGHEVRLLSDFEKTIKQKKNQLSALSEKFSKAPSGLQTTLKEKKRNIRSMITDRFESLRSKILKKELEMLFKFESTFMDEEINLNNLISNTSFQIPINLQAKLKEFNDTLSALSNPNILTLAEEDFSSLEEEFAEKLAPLEAKQTEKISKILALFQKSLPNEDLLKDFETLDPLNQDIIKSLEQKSPSPQIVDLLIPSVELDISHEAGARILKIEDSTTKKSLILKKPDREKITQVQCRLTLPKGIIENSILSVLILLSKHLVNVDSISLIIDGPRGVNREVAFYGLILTLFSHPERLKSLEISVSNVVVRDFGPLYLFEKVLPQIKDLRSFYCAFSETQTTSAVLRALTKINFSENQNLERFRLHLPGTLLEEQDIIQFLNKTPNVKDLLLGFGHTGLTDQALESFSTKILPSLNKVERLEVGLWETKLTDAGVSKFLANLPDITNLLIGLQLLRISDASIQEFLDKKLTSFNNLEELQVELSDTNVSQNLRRKIQNWTPPQNLQLHELFVDIE